MRQMGIHSKKISRLAALAFVAGCAAVSGAGSASAGPPTLAPAQAVCGAAGGTLAVQEGFLVCSTSEVMSASALQAPEQLCVHAYKTPGGDPGLFFAGATSWLCDLTPR